jgi:hypothetical protein
MLYHITTLENARKILEEGLIANIDTNSPLSEKGYIYLFENKSYRHPLTDEYVAVADDIAKNQLFMKNYVMLEIDEKGIKGELEHDNVGEFAAFAEWKVKQPRINKKYIKLFGFFTAK